MMPLYVENSDECAIVDDCDYTACEQFAWYLKKSRSGEYPCASVREGRRVKTLRLHRFIATRAGKLHGENAMFEVHHENADHMDCRRANLSVLTSEEHHDKHREEAPF